MNAAAHWLQAHVVSDDSARYLGRVAQLVVLLVAAWYVSRRVLAGAGSGAALRVPS